MQYHRDGFKPGDPDVHPAAPGHRRAGDPLPATVDVLIANLHPGLRRTPPPESPWDAVHLYPSGLTTQEVAAIMAEGNNPPDRLAAERQLVELVGEGRIRRVEMGNDAIWLAT